MVHVVRNKPVYSSAGRTEDTVVPLTAEDVSIGSSVNSVEIVALVDDSDEVVCLPFLLLVVSILVVVTA